MDWVKTMNEAITYIEEHLSENIGLSDIAKAVNISEFHFQRAFSVIAGMTPIEYLRGRRLSEAGRELATGKVQVIDVAMKFGYDSPESFTKAFRRFHGVTPMQVKGGSQLKTMNRFCVKITLEEESKLEYRIEKWDAFNLTVFMKSYVASFSEAEIPAIWKEYYENADCRNVRSRFGVCIHNQKDGDKAVYGIGDLSSNVKEIPKGFENIRIPGNEWAVFKCTGPSVVSLKNIWERIYKEWLPGSEYELILGYYDFYVEKLPEGDATSEDYVCEMCIPVKKTEKWTSLIDKLC